MNADLKLLGVFDALEKKINALDNRFDGLSKQAGPKGDKGDKGERGEKGAKGETGAKGADGRDGRDGVNGRDGRDGQDGVGVASATVDFDGHLVLTLTDGSEIDAGEIASASDVINYNMVSGSGGSGTPTVKYTAVTTTPYYITSAELIIGRNIYGVDAGQNAFVYLPTDIPADKLVTINNESDTFTLTIDTYVE